MKQIKNDKQQTKYKEYITPPRELKAQKSIASLQAGASHHLYSEVKAAHQSTRNSQRG